MGVQALRANIPEFKMKLYVGFESTWSLRAWICAHIAGLEFETIVLPLNGKDYKSHLISTTKTGLVPALVFKNTFVSDSLAIAEYLNEVSKGSLYPRDINDRAVARSLVCELHSGFFNLKNNMPFSNSNVAPVNINKEIKREVERLEIIFSKAQTDYMFAKPTVVDAFYSILAFRLNAYGVTLSGKAGKYQRSLLNWSLLNKAIEESVGWDSND